MKKKNNFSRYFQKPKANPKSKRSNARGAEVLAKAVKYKSQELGISAEECLKMIKSNELNLGEVVVESIKAQAN